MQEIQREIHMAVYTESYRDLCHGTDTCSAEKIRKDGFLSSTAKSNWCGDGTYFYDKRKHGGQPTENADRSRKIPESN